MPRFAVSLYLWWCAITASWVWLALGAQPETPAWLNRTREICFGTLADGLPDLHGWISLAAPLPLLLVLVVLMKAELTLAWRRHGLFLLALPLVILAFGAFRTYQGLQVRNAFTASGPEEALPLDYPRLDLPCPPYLLVDQGGRSWSQADMAGQVTLLTFAYAHCQTVCPLLLSNMGRVGARPQIVVVTLDPRRDTCGTLQGWARHMGLPETALILSGQIDRVEGAARAFEVPFERDNQTGEITHPPLVFVIDRRGRLSYRFNNPSTLWLRQALERLAP